MFRRRVAVLMPAAAVVSSACSSSATTAPGGGGAQGCKVGVSWNNYQEERWAKWDEPAIKEALAAAGVDAGAAVIAYDRLIEDPKSLYITFDNVEVGRMQARAIFAAVPKGNYVVIKGNS